MGEVVVLSVEQGLKDLFRWVYTENCEIDSSPLSNSDRETIEDLDEFEVLENLKDLLQELLAAKRELKNTDKAELIARCEQFESMLQKLENDVRSHIRVLLTQIQQQLKLHLDSVQARIEELESSPASQQLEQLKETLKSREKELTDLRSRFSPTLELLERTAGSRKDHKRILSLEPIAGEARKVEKTESDGSLPHGEKRHKSVVRLEQEIIALKTTLQAKNIEIEKLRSSVTRELLPILAESKKTEDREKPRASSHTKLRFDRALSERQDAKKSLAPEAEPVAIRRPVLSPYKGVDQSRSHSKSRLNPSPIPYLRGDKHHARTISDRVKRPAASVRSHYKA